MPVARDRLPPGTDLVAHLLSLPAERRGRAVRLFGREELEALDRDWRSWAHDGQCPPEGAAWSTWVIMAGRGFGKTLAGAHWVAQAAHADGNLRVALVAATLDEARRVMIEGDSGLLRIADAYIAGWTPSRRLLRFHSGAEATLFSGASPDQLRGPQHHLAWCDELAKWKHPGDTWDNLQFGLRLGRAPRALVTTTPRPGPVLRRIMAEPGCVVTRGRTGDNPHLSPAYRASIAARYAGTRLGRQELDGELLADAGALWTAEGVAASRRDPAGEDRPFARVVIGVDPPSGDGTCGIVACALASDGVGHVLADHSVTARSPEGWAHMVADAARLHRAERVVAERNQGGRMVEAVLRAADRTMAVKLVNASEGKSVRAEPIALLFEAGRVRLRGRFPELEAELLGLVAGGGWQGMGASPDRADAMVWALTELMLGSGREARVRGLG